MELTQPMLAALAQKLSVVATEHSVSPFNEPPKLILNGKKRPPKPRTPGLGYCACGARISGNKTACRACTEGEYHA